MTVDDALLIKLEKLSSLEIQNSSRNEVKTQIENIIDFMENLSELDDRLSGIEFPNIDKSLSFRPDEPKNSQITESVLKNAPKTENNFFIVPKIIE